MPGFVHHIYLYHIILPSYPTNVHHILNYTVSITTGTRWQSCCMSFFIWYSVLPQPANYTFRPYIWVKWSASILGCNRKTVGFSRVFILWCLFEVHSTSWVNWKVCKNHQDHLAVNSYDNTTQTITCEWILFWINLNNSELCCLPQPKRYFTKWLEQSLYKMYLCLVNIFQGTQEEGSFLQSYLEASSHWTTPTTIFQ